MSSPRKLIQQTIATKNFEEAFYVVDVDNIIEKHNRWLSNMPLIKPYYAVKCNSTPGFLEILAALGIGFDCASKSEIADVLSIGVSPKRIIYAHPCKSKSNIEYAMKENVDLMTFDNEEELYKIADTAPDARLIVRIKADDSHSKYPLQRKFGVIVEKVPNLLQVAKHLGLNVVGVSFHVGGLCESCEPYVNAIEDAAHVFEIGKELGFEMTLLDIGSGFPGIRDSKEALLFDEIARSVNCCIAKCFPPEKNVEVIAEPGRYYVATAFTLTVTVIAKRKEIINDQSVIMYYVNDGTHGSFRYKLFEDDELVPIPQIEDNPYRKRKVYHSIIWGPTCDGMDCICTKVMLPEMNVGEWMTFENMGAYTVVLCTKFNGIQMPITKYHASESAIEFLKNLPFSSRKVQLLNLNDS